MKNGFAASVATALIALTAGVLSVGFGRAEGKTGLKPVAVFAGMADERARRGAVRGGRQGASAPALPQLPPGWRRAASGSGEDFAPTARLRGEADFRTPGMTCVTCHAELNASIVAQSDDLKSVPGHPEWHLAPIEGAWVNRSLGRICEQIKDPGRNGGKSLAEIVGHMAHDSLVGWGWTPGEGREPAPGTHEVFGAVREAWAGAGAHCPAA